jgi:hypothetical protein
MTASKPGMLLIVHHHDATFSTNTFSACAHPATDLKIGIVQGRSGALFL